MENITNQIHCIDNLLLLPQIPSNSINLIYNAVLFGTARKFKDFQDLELDYKAIENHYLPRFKEMKRVLADNGTIYIHADEKISHWLRIILDDIFGIDNFRNEIIWAYNSAPRKKGCLGKRHDKILRYTKTDNFTFKIEGTDILKSKYIYTKNVNGLDIDFYLLNNNAMRPETFDEIALNLRQVF